MGVVAVDVMVQGSRFKVQGIGAIPEYNLGKESTGRVVGICISHATVVRATYLGTGTVQTVGLLASTAPYR
jgi:hypothetical protein